MTCGRSWVRAPSVPRRESCRICGSFFLCLENYMKQFAMPTSPCAASRLGTVAASAVYGQPCVHPHESELSASAPMFVRAWRIANAQKNREHFCSRFNCGRWDLNPHGVPTTRSLVLLVCQFRHFRVFLIKLSRMQEMGLEPTLCCHNRHLKPARLPFRHSCEQMLLY